MGISCAKLWSRPFPIMLLCGVPVIGKSLLWSVNTGDGRAIAQAVSRRPLSVEARVRSWASPCFSRFSPVSFIPPVLHYLEERKKRIIFITWLHKKPQGCGASVASAAGQFAITILVMVFLVNLRIYLTLYLCYSMFRRLTLLHLVPVKAIKRESIVPSLFIFVLFVLINYLRGKRWFLRHWQQLR